MASIVGGPSQSELDPNQNKLPGQNQAGSTITATPAGAISTTTPQASGGNAAQNFNKTNQAPRQIGSGSFTNINSYLNANKQAGQQLGQTLQSGITQKLDRAKEVTGRTLGEAANQQSTAAGMYNKGMQQYASLGGAPAPAAGQPQQQFKDAAGNPIVKQQTYSVDTPTGDNAAKGTLASEYTADIGSRQKAAADLASNADALKAFTGLRTGATQSEQQGLMQQTNQTAADTAEAYKQQQMKRMQQLATETGRGGLLSEFVGGKNYGIGKRSLDSTFLQRDPNRATDVLKKNIGAQGENVKKSLADVAASNVAASNLNAQGTDLSGKLGAQTAQNTADYLSNIQSRIPLMEAQRKAKLDWAQNQLKSFQGGQDLNKEFLADLDTKAGTQLFNVPKNLQDVSEVMDVSNLKKSLGLSDVANQADVANYAAMAKLQGLSPDAYALDKSTADTQDIAKYTDDRTLTARAEKAKQDFLKQAAGDIVTGETGSVGGMRGYASQNALDFLTGGNNRSVQGINAAAGQSMSPGSFASMLSQGGQIGATLAPTIGGALGSVVPGVGNVLGSVAGAVVAPAVAQAGQQLAAQAQTPGGDIEKGLHVGLEAAMGGATVLPGDLGVASRNLAGVGQSFISNLANTFGMGGDNSAEEAKDMGYAKQRSGAYLDNALASYLKNAGFSNYMGQSGLKTADTSVKGTWDGTTWQDPSKDLAAFGYGQNMLPGVQTLAPKLGAVAPPSQQVGMYAPAVEASRSPVNNLALQGGAADRNAILAQLAASGQLNDNTGLDNIGKLG